MVVLVTSSSHTSILQQIAWQTFIVFKEFLSLPYLLQKKRIHFFLY